MSELRSLTQQTRCFIAAMLCLALAFALVTQYAGSEPVLDEAYGASLLMPQGDADDSETSPESTTAFAALPASLLPLPARITYSFSTTRHLTAAYLHSFIIAPSRAPPSLAI